MHPPLSLGTILQNRYYLIDLLGQGRSGRTYLAKDQGRDNEFCVLKEFIPESTDEVTLQQYSDRFSEEAFSLFRIRHPQIPQYRATFEQDGRLFLVREYIPGKTSRSLQRDRIVSASLLSNTGTADEPLLEESSSSVGLSDRVAFSSDEVCQLLQQLLPVLEYLHSMEIAHGNISPDNIIWSDRTGDPPNQGEASTELAQTPVLIDLAVEKELVNQLTPLALTGDKPPESERSPTTSYSPSTDLYSLALTAVILLTAREPQELLSENQLRKDWQQWATVSPDLTRILNRMLSAKPEERYQSANEVAKALQSALDPVPERRKPIPDRSTWNYTWAYALSLGLVLLVSLGSWAVLKYMLNPTQLPIPIIPGADKPPSNPSKQATRTSAKPITSSKPLNVVANQTTTVKGNLKANEILTYVIPGQQGQQLNASVTGKGVLLNVFNPNRKPIHDRNKPVQTWKGGLFSSGDYYIQLRPVKASDKKEYKLDASLTDYFPKKMCQEPEAGSVGTWYPVFVEYSRKTLNLVQSQYCRDTLVAPKAATKGPSLQVGSFGDRFQAEAFANLLKGEIGSGEVGEPINGSLQHSCSDRAEGGAQIWYPVLVEYTKEKYIQLLSYCPNAAIATPSNRKGSYIEVAAFQDKSKAVEMANFITKEVGSAQVGEAITRSTP